MELFINVSQIWLYILRKIVKVKLIRATICGISLICKIIGILHYTFYF